MVDTVSGTTPGASDDAGRAAPEAEVGWRGRLRARADTFAAAQPERFAWYRALAVGLGALVASRVIVFAGAYARAAQEINEQQSRFLPLPGSMREMIHRTFWWQWDGKWYHMIASNGYPRELAEQITYLQGRSASVAFFPVYPLLARWFDHAFPGGVTEAMLGVNVVLSVFAVVLVGLLARDLYDVEAARRAMILFCLFPGSVALSWGYAEAAMVVFVAAAFVCLHRERWLLAGSLAAVATATRPNAIGIIAACAIAAGLAVWKRRQWRALLAVVLAPAGVVGYHLFLAHHTGESGAWLRAQREAWDEGWSWGATAVRFTWRFVENPLGSSFGATYMHTAFALLCTAIGLYCSIRKRLPLPMLAYVAGVVALMVAPETVSARPRFVFAAFPLVIGVAAWWPRRSRFAWEALVVLNAGALVAFTNIYASWAAIP